MNKVKPLNLGATLAATVLVLYLLCALFVLAVPNGMESVLKLVAHSVNLDPVFEQAPNVTFVGVVGGSLAVAFYFFVTGAVFGWIYNRFDR
jgi:hypothetical protein